MCKKKSKAPDIQQPQPAQQPDTGALLDERQRRRQRRPLGVNPQATTPSLLTGAGGPQADTGGSLLTNTTLGG